MSSYRFFITGKRETSWGEIVYYVKTGMRGKAELLKRIIEILKPDRIHVFDGEIVLGKDNKDIRLDFLLSEEVEITVDKDLQEIIETILPAYDEEETDEYTRWGE